MGFAVSRPPLRSLCVCALHPDGSAVYLDALPPAVSAVCHLLVNLQKEKTELLSSTLLIGMVAWVKEKLKHYNGAKIYTLQVATANTSVSTEF